MKVTNAVGEVTEVFDTLITVVALPEALSIVADQASYCPGDMVTLTGNGADSYLWFDERSVYPVTDENPYEFRIFVSRNYHLLGINETGCKDTTSIFIQVDEGINAQIDPSDTIICAGSPVVFTATGGESYLWITKNDTLSNESTLEVSFETSTILGLMGTTASGCPGFDYADIKVNEKPEATVVREELLLLASEAEAYQWYKDDEEIPGATEQSYTAESSGNYFVVVEGANGCTDASEPIAIEIITGLEELGLLASIQSYPNPTNGYFTLELSGPRTGQFEFQIRDITGKIIDEGTFLKMQENHQLQLQLNSKPGVYLLKITNDENTSTLKILKK